MYDYLIVGAGLFGAVFAHEAKKHGKSCLVVEKRNHIAGNIYCKNVDGIHVHQYGAHIFHTSDRKIWDYINQFSEFNNYINSPVAIYKDELYNLPFNMNTFSKMWNIQTPAQAKAKIAEQIADLGITEPKNLEEQAEQSADTAFENALVMNLIEKVQDPIPHCMFEQRADSLMDHFANQLKQQGVSMDLYLQYTGMDADSLKATYLDRAENEVKLRLALEQIAKQENLEVSDEEVDESLKELADANNLTVEEVKVRIPLADYKMDQLVTKAMDFVKEHAVVDNTIEEEQPAEEAAAETSDAE